MSDDGFPSMTALLGLLAVAGYQNKDKIAEMLGMHGQGATQTGAGSGAAIGQSQPGGLGGLLGGFAGGSQSGGGFLGGGLNQLIDRFTQSGHGPVAQSWVNSGPNQAIEPTHLEQAIGPDILASLTEKTGLSREDLLARLSKTLPQAVDQYTPNGRLPT